MNSNSLSDVDKILNELRQSGTASHIENIDFTWNINNQLIVTREMLTILLAKTSCMPLVPNFTDPNIVKKLGITSEQASMIEKFNSELVYIHGLLQKSIITDYVSSSISKEMIDRTIDSLPQTDMSNLLEFIENYNNTKSDGIQTGGQINVFVKGIIFLLFLICINSTSDVNLALVDPSKKTYSSGIAKYSPDEFTNELVTQSRISSGPIQSSGIVAAYDREIDKELKTVYGKLKQFLQLAERKKGSEILQEYAIDFNKRSSYFSKQVEDNCLDLMVKCKDNGVFNEFTDMDTIEQTEKKITELSNETDKQINNITEDSMKDLTGLAITAATATLSGDPITTGLTMGAFVSRLGVNFYEYLSVTNALVKEKQRITDEQKSVIQQAESLMPISKEDKIEFEQKIYEFSRIYCSLGYNLKIVTTDDTIRIDGDKVPYISMINLITTLHDNLQLQITQLATSSNKNSEDARLMIASLISIQQRLGILKKITEMLTYVVNRSAKIQIMKTNDYPNPDSIEEVKSFFDSQLAQLENLLSRLNTSFPEREQKIEENIKLLEDEKMLAEKGIDIKVLQQDIQDIKQNETSIIMQRKTQRLIRSGENIFNAAGSILQSWSNMGLNMTEGVTENLSKYTLALSNLAGAGPLAIIDGILKFLNKALYKLMTNPSFFVLLACGLLFLEFTIGGITGKIKIFYNASKQIIVTVVFGPFVLVYKLFKTPFGYAWKQLSTLYVTKNQRTITPQEEDAIQGLLALGKRGGKKRKTHKHKHKKNKTRKIRHRKRHNTRHKRHHLTKKH